jgi:DNA-binding transcriptional MerR regulator
MEILCGEAAKILKLSTNHVRYLENTGQLRCRRLGRWRVFDADEVHALAKKRYELATGQVTHWRTASDA